MNLSDIQYHETEVVVDDTETAYDTDAFSAEISDSSVPVLDLDVPFLDLNRKHVDLQFGPGPLRGPHGGNRLFDELPYVWVDLGELEPDQWAATVPALVTQLYLQGGAGDLESELVRSAGRTPSSQLIGRISAWLRPGPESGEFGEVVFSEPVELALPVIAGGIATSAGETSLEASFSQETTAKNTLGIKFRGMSLVRSCTFSVTTGLDFTCGPGEGVVGELLFPFWKTVRKWRPEKGSGEWLTNVSYAHDGTGRAMVGTRARVVPPGELLGLAARSRYIPLRGDARHISKNAIEIKQDTELQFGGGVYGAQLGVTATLQRTTSTEFAVKLPGGSDRQGLELEAPTGLVVRGDERSSVLLRRGF